MPTDLFGRTTSFGLGTDGTFTYVWSERDSSYTAAADSLFHVDGSQLVIPDTDGSDWDSYIISAPTPAKSGSASFDLFLPAVSGPVATNYIAPAFLHLSWTDQIAFGAYVTVMLGIEQDFNHPNTDPHVYFGPYDGTFDADFIGITRTHSIPVELGNWYTAKVSYSVTGTGNSTQVLSGYKLWKTADPEPSEYLFVHETNALWMNHLESWGDGDDGKPWLEFFYTGTLESYLDNLTFDSTTPTLYRNRYLDATIRKAQTGSATADAEIATGQVSLLADAVIRRTQAGSLTADAVRFKPGLLFTANAVVLRAQTGLALLDAEITPRRIFADAFITDNGLWRHRWFWDHDGTIDDTAIELDATVGSYPAGTSFRQLLEELWLWAAASAPSAVIDFGTPVVSPTAIRNQHHRTNDHDGLQPLSSLILAEEIPGRYPSLPTYAAGASVIDVLNDLYSRLAASPPAFANQFTAAAVIEATIAWEPITQVPTFFEAVAAIRRTASGSRTANAVVRRSSSGSFTADAVVV